MNDESLDLASKKLTLIAALLIRSRKDIDQVTNAETIELLDAFDLPNSEIALMTGMKQTAVSMARSRLRKGK